MPARQDEEGEQGRKPQSPINTRIGGEQSSYICIEGGQLRDELGRRRNWLDGACQILGGRALKSPLRILGRELGRRFRSF
jgi:hypothetical protein